MFLGVFAIGGDLIIQSPKVKDNKNKRGQFAGIHPLVGGVNLPE
jgi:hypothetical protein